jgi:hypothetical protein
MTFNFLLSTILALALACAALPVPAASTAERTKADVPPSADLRYSIQARQKGMSLKGDAQIRWRAANGRYSMSNETHAMLLGTILEEKSEGAIDAYGLAPASFMQQRYRKPAARASFDRKAGVIRFSDSAKTYPIKGGEQDRGSAVWQLMAIARAAPAKFKAGTSWTFLVAGPRDADPWTFKVIGQEKIRAPQGELAAVHIQKSPPPDSRDQQIDIWLAPSLDWLPVRLRYTEGNGDTIEQTLERISKK